ncbi:MAG: hypothetical protein HYV07_17695 [Deltaproteobacteria bacterium]|nr:hypothetical protein [Deltaproteobacteria bacterium]
MSRRARLFAFAASVAMHGALLVVAASLDRADPEPVAAPLRGDFIRLELRPSGTPREKPAEASRAASDLAIDTVEPQINSSRGSRRPEGRVDTPRVSSREDAPGVAPDRAPRVAVSPSASGSVQREAAPTIDLRPSVRIDVPSLVPGASEAEPGPTLEARAGGGGHAKDTEFELHVARDGTMEIEDRFPVRPPSIRLDEQGQPHVVFGFDFNDAILRALGDDPYGYEKQKLAHATREDRQRLSRAACAEDLRESLVDARARLDRVLASSLSLERKKRAFFELWDQCVEDGPEETVRVAMQIRATVLAFVVANLPANSPLGYTEEELERLNRTRASRQAFAPYSP